MVIWDGKHHSTKLLENKRNIASILAGKVSAPMSKVRGIIPVENMHVVYICIYRVSQTTKSENSILETIWLRISHLLDFSSKPSVVQRVSLFVLKRDSATNQTEARSCLGVLWDRD